MSRDRDLGREALEAERLVLKPLPELGELFDVVVSPRVSRDCLVSFEGRRYSVPFPWVGREVEILGTLRHVVIRSGGVELARHPRRTRARLVIDPAHHEGDSTDQVLRPSPLGHRARLQLLGFSWPAGDGSAVWLPPPERVRRPLDAYVELVEALQRVPPPPPRSRSSAPRPPRAHADLWRRHKVTGDTKPLAVAIRPAKP